MACDHTGPPELIEMAETHLGERGVVQTDWNGLRFAWGENVDTMWKSVWLEVIRRDDQWIVTRIDRSENPLPPEKLGFHALGVGLPDR